MRIPVYRASKPIPLAHAVVGAVLICLFFPPGVAVGDPTSFSGAVSSSVKGRVTNISVYAKYSGSAIPMVLCHDGLGQSGDSGALVEVNGLPTAMHLSKITLDNGGFESHTILLEQVEKLLAVDLFN